MQAIDSTYLLLTVAFSWSQRARVIFKATKQHATNLAKFVTIYKTLLLVQRRANGGKEKSADSFLAGLVGGYLVFGDRTAINEQVCEVNATHDYNSINTTKS